MIYLNLIRTFKKTLSEFIARSNKTEDASVQVADKTKITASLASKTLSLPQGLKAAL